MNLPTIEATYDSLRFYRRDSALEERLNHLKESLANFLTFICERPLWPLLSKGFQTVGSEAAESGLTSRLAAEQMEGPDGLWVSLLALVL